ncbi:hypothetical protein [Phormidesmis priestleyi]|uniref:hypothetical protein n=1 Tax=Phormidesmis priestleyi TaxID=268141 RepID=UPI000839E64C|nr:hypothetical protein [Phormidesmis priestleyi]
MRSLPMRLIGQTLLLLSLVELPATATQVWIGSGRITAGIGQGGLVGLKLATDQERIQEGGDVKSLHGPRLDGKIQAGMVQSPLGLWQFKQCEQDLCVILNRADPKQTIVYRLHRKNRGSAE